MRDVPPIPGATAFAVNVAGGGATDPPIDSVGATLDAVKTAGGVTSGAG